MMREPAFSRVFRPHPVSLEGKAVLVLGLGDTGRSVTRWVESEGGTVRGADTRRTGPFRSSLLEAMDLVCISPGLALSEPIVAEAQARGIPVLGDIELFAWHVRAKTKSKVVAITGTNGKTTVTSLTGHLLRTAGVDVEVAGNISPAALFSLHRRKGHPPAVWVLELSSYQLETTWSLAPDAAALLNVTEDHLDRYASIDEYAAAKARVFEGAGVQVLNRDDPRSMAMAREGARMTFGLDAPQVAWDFGVRDGWLVHGRDRLLRASELRIRGAHNVANALAAAALARAHGVPPEAVREGLRAFVPDPHRIMHVGRAGGVDYIDDSKATTAHAAAASLAAYPSIVWVAGGQLKGADVTDLVRNAAPRLRGAVLLGVDRAVIRDALARHAANVPVVEVSGDNTDVMDRVVAEAARLASPGDTVLLAPAGASLDMFSGYGERGEAFARAVRRLPGYTAPDAAGPGEGGAG